MSRVAKMSGVRIAYVISAYKNPEHLSRLVHRLHTGSETSFRVHIDSKTDERTFEQFREELSDLEGVRFLSRHACHWGGFGHVRASLKGIDSIVASDDDPDYVVLLSGGDYPIKPNAYIRDFLERGDGRSFIMHFPLPTQSWSRGGLDRVGHWHLRWHRLHVRLPLRRKLPASLRPWGGSAYWIVSRAALRTIHEFVQANPEYVRFFQHVDIPDELFFQTILLNSREAERCVDHRLHYTEWSRPPAPSILLTEDYPQLAESACLFARKFDQARDARILDLIDEGLLA
jgi:core-2/I-Branching enzyme